MSRTKRNVIHVFGKIDRVPESGKMTKINGSDGWRKEDPDQRPLAISEGTEERDHELQSLLLRLLLPLVLRRRTACNVIHSFNEDGRD